MALGNALLSNDIMNIISQIFLPCVLKTAIAKDDNLLTEFNYLLHHWAKLIYKIWFTKLFVYSLRLEFTFRLLLLVADLTSKKQNKEQQMAIR